MQDLSVKVKQIQEKLAKQITADFHNTLMTSSTSSHSGDKLSLSQLADACSVVSVLEDQKVKADLLKWFICKLKQFHHFDGIIITMSLSFANNSATVARIRAIIP